MSHSPAIAELHWSGRAARMSVKDYAEAFEHGYGLTLRFLMSRGAALDDAEEIAQAAWAKGWEYRGQLHDPGRVAVWVNSIAKNMLLNHYSRGQRMESLNDAQGFIVTNGDSPLMAVEVLNLLERCRPRDRAVLKRHYLEGQTTAEIAADIGVTPTAVRVRLLRIRQSLRKQLSQARWMLNPVRLLRGRTKTRETGKETEEVGELQS